MTALRTPKAERPCCVAKRDELGRLPVGWCGPDCLGRKQAQAVHEPGTCLREGCERKPYRRGWCRAHLP